MEARHQKKIESLRLFLEAHDLKIIHEEKCHGMYRFVTDAIGLTPVELRNLTNFRRVGISLFVENGVYTIAVLVYFT